MIDRLAPDFVNTRRANRVAWERPITIVDPVKVPGKTINVSAVGILLSTDRNLSLQLGSPIALDIPHIEGTDSITVHGQIVRLERTRSDLRVAVNLA
jgi:hypothetical protein